MKIKGRPMDYDLVIVGGGLAGSSLGAAMAATGARVLIIEREIEFRDRVRGEGMLPWGAAEARELGVYQPLIDSCALETRWWTAPDDHRDLVQTTPSGLGCLNFYHPEMQQQLLDLAIAAGVELWRPTEVTGVTPGDPPCVFARWHGMEQRVTARLVVGADGRNSRVRVWAGFPVRRDPDCLTAAGTLYRNLALPEDAVQFVLNPGMQRLSIIFPIGRDRYRTYLVFRHGTRHPLSGGKDQRAFVDESVATGAPVNWFRDGDPIGPLASFDAPDNWADHPYRDGVALVGDAAAASDPCFGCGLSLSLRDVRVLRDRLTATPDFAATADAYAAEHDRYYDSLRRIHGWFRDLWFGADADAEALRTRAFPKISEDPSRVPDFIAVGPEAPSDEVARRRMFAED
jgi:2-polyprenyl-6-methoxyphenol hydroxylase-like FAD-dependent oxidoreductase